MNRPSILNVSGRMLREIREAAGWSRPRLADALVHHRTFDGDFASIKSIERYESLPVVAPVQVERYRQVIGPELFDELLVQWRKQEAEAIQRRLRKP